MSKSLGNVLWRSTRCCSGPGRCALRYLLAAPHYRSSIEVGEDSLAEADGGVPADRGLRDRARPRLGAAARSGAADLAAAEVPEAFVAAMDDDLGTSRRRSPSCTRRCGPATPRWPPGDTGAAARRRSPSAR